MQGTRVWSLVRKLRSHVLFGRAKKIYIERERRREEGREGNIVAKKEKKHCPRCNQPPGGCPPSCVCRVSVCMSVFSNPACVCMCVQSCPILCEPMDYCPQSSSVHGILQARILEWIAISFSRGSSQARDRTHVSCISRQILCHWATGKTLQNPTARTNFLSSLLSS